MEITKQGDRLLVRFGYNPRTVQFVKTLDGRVFIPAEKAWSIPFVGCQASVDKMINFGFKIDDWLYAEIEDEENQAEKLVSLADKKDTKIDSSLPLYGYQRVGVKFLSEIGSGLLGDEVGLGKTIMALALTEHANRTLVICPSALKYQWQAEIRKFLKEDATVLDGTLKQRRRQFFTSAISHEETDALTETIYIVKGTRFTIMNYELLLREDFLMVKQREWDYIIADEATKISNHSAKVSKAIKKLKSKHRIAMSGTPISNRANEIWNVIDFTNPGVLGNYWAFQNRYCIKNYWGAIDGYQNLDELADKLKRYMIRRTKEEVLPDLPTKTIIDVPFKLSKEEKKLYDSIKQEILFEIEEADIDKIENPMSIQHTLVKMIRLRQLTDSMELLGSNKKSTKLEVLHNLLAECIDSGHKCIVFTQFAKMAQILVRELMNYKPLFIVGDTPAKDRKDIVDQFNKSEENKILVMTSAGQYGLNIQGASALFHFDQEWSLAKMVQRAGRAHRIGQTKKVLEYNLLAKGSIDMYVKKVLHEKAELSNKLLDDPITMQDIKKMLDYE